MDNREFSEKFNAEAMTVLRNIGWQWNFSEDGTYAFNLTTGDAISGVKTKEFLVYQSSLLLEGRYPEFSQNELEKHLNSNGYKLAEQSPYAAVDKNNNLITGECFEWLLREVTMFPPFLKSK